MTACILPMILLAPMVGVLILCLLPASQTQWVRRIAVLATGISLAGALHIVFHYDRQTAGYQFNVLVPWIQSLGIGFHLGVDGINAVLVLLHAICAFTGVLISYSIKERVKEYYIFYLILITGVFGVFTSMDLFFF